MADRSLIPVGPELGADPIARIARADQARTELPQPEIIDQGPDLIEPSRPLAPQGHAARVDAALGSVKLPTLLELSNALEAMTGHAELMQDIDPAMTDVILAVLEDEQAKVMRYIDLKTAG